MILMFIVGCILAQIFIRNATALTVTNTITLILVALRMNYMEYKFNKEKFTDDESQY